MRWKKGKKSVLLVGGRSRGLGYSDNGSTAETSGG